MSHAPSSAPRVVRFGAFELDLRSGELRKSGIRVGLQEQPLHVLRLLLDQPGELVTREQLRQALWPEDTFVDFEHGLNAATKRLRDALGDSAESPRFIETLPRRGYRFIAPMEAAGASAAMDPPRYRLALAVAIVVAVLGALGWHALRQGPSNGRRGAALVTRSVIELSPDAPLSLGAESPTVGFDGPLIAVSPDGTQIVYVGRSNGQRRLFIRPAAGEDVRPIAGTEGAIHPFFSPDGRWLGFLTNDKVKKVSLDGGPPLTLGSVKFPVRATWTVEDAIYVSAREGQDLFRVRADGGTPVQVNRRDAVANDLTFDHVLPDGKWALAGSWSHNISRDHGDVLLMSLETGETKVLVRSGYDARYVPPGYLLFARAGNLLGVRFDLGRREVLGEPVLVGTGASMESFWGQAQMALSSNGLLVYASGGDRSLGQLAWVDRRGQIELLDVPPRLYGVFHLDPRDDRVALHVVDVTDYVWIYDLRRREGRRMALAGNSGWPLWHPDAVTIAFSSWSLLAHGQPWTVSIGTADGRADPRQVLSRRSHLLPSSWSPDGTVLATSVVLGGSLFVRVAEASGDSESIASPGAFPSFSPSGRWVAYQKTDSSPGEVWVRSYPDGETQRQISSDGGIEPFWGRNGELFYRKGGRWMSTMVNERPELSWAPPRQVFETDFIDTPGLSYGVSGDGQRLLVLKPVHAGTTTKLHLVANWPAIVDRAAAGVESAGHVQ